MGPLARAALLLVVSAALAGLLEAVGLPAGLLLGPMVAAVAFASRGAGLTVPAPLFVAAQALIGLLIAPSLNLSILTAAARQPWLFLGATSATLVASMAIAWLLARLRMLPGPVAVWGSMPGAATAMVLMARDEGADWQLVAVMSYLRVICVALIASVLAAVVTGHAGSHPPAHGWFPRLDGRGLAETATIGLAGAWAGHKIRLPAGALLGPMILAAGLEVAGLAHPQLPGWLLASAYLLIGWRIGFGFTPPIFAAARRSAPRVLAAILTLILFCAGCGLALARISGKDPMTCYLAMSPGGADSVAIIANATSVNVSFVMAMQMLRFVAVLIVGPPLAGVVARRFNRDVRPADAANRQPTPGRNS